LVTVELLNKRRIPVGPKEKVDYDEELDKQYLRELREEEQDDDTPELDLDDPANYDFGDSNEDA